MKIKTITLTAFIFVLSLSSACNLPAVGAPDPAGIATRVALTLTAQAVNATPTETEAPPTLTATLPPSETVPLPTETETPTPEPLPPSATPTVPQVAAKIYTYGILKSGQYLVTLLFEQPVTGTYAGRVDGLDFKCDTLPQYADRLYCSGPDLTENKRVTVELIDQASGQVVFTGEFRVPPKITPSPTPRR